MTANKYLLPILIFIIIFIIFFLLIINLDDNKEKFDTLPVSEIIVVNRKIETPVKEPNLTPLLCNPNNQCLGKLNFNYQKLVK